MSSKKHNLRLDIGLIIISIIILIIISITFGCSPQKIYDYKWKITPIYSLSLSSNIEGNFILGSGFVNEVVYYYYYRQEEDGKVLDSIRADYVIIIENDSEMPSLREHYCPNYPCDNSKHPYYDRLYVPTNTIKTNFDLDTNKI